MMNRRCKRFCCMNNDLKKYNSNLLETSCNNISCSENSYNENCSCGFDEEDSVFPSNPMLAQTYIPYQFMEDTFKPCIGLNNGTVFPELVSPYMPGDSMKEIQYIEDTNTIGEGCNQ